jgi:acetyl esterase/lipase
VTKFELSRMPYGNGFLHGLVNDEDRKAFALHVHGTGGSFYRLTVSTAFADSYLGAGADYATVNVPGTGNEAATEVLDASLPALRAWIEQLARGRDLIWQGHSLGASKVIRLLSSSPELRARTRAVVLLSPIDLAALYARSTEDSVRAEKLAAARADIAAGHGDGLVRVESFDLWPVTNNTYARALERGSDWDLFPTGLGSAGVLAGWTDPILVVLGGADFASSPDARSVAEILRAQAPAVRTELIEGAPHSFQGYEPVVADLIADFLASQP